MKKYKDRFLRKISTAINVTYLITAIMWGLGTFSFANSRAELKEDYEEGEMSQEEFIEENMEFTKKEEKFFGMLSTVAAVDLAADVAFYFGTKDKDL